MDRYDAAVLGSGPEGLVAAVVLARAGLKTLLLDKAEAPGGRARSREFHPGFRASLYSDELAAIPNRLYRSLELARHGAVLLPSRASVCLSASGESVLFADEGLNALSVPPAMLPGLTAFRRQIETARAAIENRAALIATPKRRRWFGARNADDRSPAWPDSGFLAASLDELLGTHICDSTLRLHLAADAVSGRAVSPFLTGTALHALAPGVGGSGQPPSGLGRLAAALAAEARASGVTLRCGAEVTDIHIRHGRVSSLVVAGTAEVETRAIVSALDLKRTMLGLIHWKELPDPLVKRVGRFRMAGARARVLFALDGRPCFAFGRDPPGAGSGPIHVIGTMEALSSAHDVWRAGVLPEAGLVTLRVPSLADPRLAPIGKATMTATLSAIPAQLFDGPWNEEKRSRLVALALAAAERAMPGVTSLVLAHQTVTGADLETELGLTGGDLEGGEIAPDQVLGFRPFGEPEWQDARTPIHGLYLAGSSAAGAPFFLGVAGERAARAMLADLREGRLN